MLTLSELRVLEYGLRSDKVLSVFLAQAPSDPAARHGWRVRVDEVIRDVRKESESASRDEGVALRRAIDRFEQTLDEAGGVVREPGWVGYIGPDRVHLAQVVPVAMITAASWGTGIRIAPLIRAIQNRRPAIIAIVDSRRAVIYRYHEEHLQHVDTLRAHAHTEPGIHMGGAPRQHFHAGTRGRTGTDQAQRERLAGRRHLMTLLVERMLDLSRPDAWLLLGGAPVAVHEALAVISPLALGRVRLMPELHLRATPAEITAVAARGAEMLHEARDLELVERTVEAAGAAGRGATGLQATSAAVGDGRASQVLLSPRFLGQFPAEAEQIIRGALDEHAAIDVVSGRAQDILDTRVGGIAAILRYPAGRLVQAAGPT
jgi:hypothetical protein